MQAKSHLHLVTSQGEKRAVEDQPGTRGVGRLRNTDYRKREHLTESEIEKLIEAAKTNRYGHRNATMVIVAYRHALRASELCDLTWDAIDFRAATMHVTRRKHGQATTHQISGPELKALRKLQREQESNHTSCSSRSATASRSIATASTGWSSEPGRRLAFRSKFTPTCSAILPATRWPTPARTRGRSRPTSGTGTSAIRFATPSCRRPGSRTSSRIEAGTSDGRIELKP